MTIANRLMAGIVAGAVVGTMGLLVAPKPGKESKQAVVDGTSHWQSKTGGAFQNLRHKPREGARGGAIKERRNRHLVITK